jgi:hypothetical protein
MEWDLRERESPRLHQLLLTAKTTRSRLYRSTLIIKRLLTIYSVLKYVPIPILRIRLADLPSESFWCLSIEQSLHLPLLSYPQLSPTLQSLSLTPTISSYKSLTDLFKESLINLTLNISTTDIRTRKVLRRRQLLRIEKET